MSTEDIEDAEDELTMLLNRLAQQLLSEEELGRAAGLPPRGQGWGDWYLSVRLFPTPCRYCHCARKDNYQRMAVLEYLADADAEKRVARRHPGWDVLGWMAWYECKRCGEVLFAPVSVETVRAWGRSGWERMKGKER